MRALVQTIAVAALLCAGCIESEQRVGLSPDGNRVQVVSQEAVDGCTFLNVLVSEQLASSRSFQDNVDSGTNDLRNRTAYAGGTDLVLDAPEPLDSCRTCALVSGRAYRCHSADGTVTPSNGQDAGVSVSNGEDVSTEPSNGLDVPITPRD